MKKLIVLITLTLLTTTASAGVVCKKDGGRWYPANEKAIKIATMLGVKTCSGKRFKAVVAKLGFTSNVKASKKNMKVEDVVSALSK